MVTTHRGHTIEVRREESLGGDHLLYFTIVRDSDGYFCLDSFEDSDETVRDKIWQLKDRVDAELEENDPWEECASNIELIDVSVVSDPLPEYEFKYVAHHPV